MDSVLRSGFDPSAGEAIVLKIRIRPFTLGHYFLLEELESPFLNDFLPVQRQDLVKAVVICSHPQKKARAGLTSRSSRIMMYVIGLLNSGGSLDAETGKFSRYLKLNRELPAARCNPGVKTRQAPECWRLLVMLMREFQMTLEQALGTPVRQANCLWAVNSELQGAIELMPSDSFNQARLEAFREFADRRSANN
jgi:hypothetical protein